MAKYTKEGYNALSEELERLKTQGRDEIAERIKVARSFGDLSENAEYDEAMNDQAKLEANIAKLEADLRDATIIDENEANDTSVVRVGSTVLVFDEDAKEEVTYKILGKSNIDKGIISDQSPVGAALLGKAVGEVAEVTLPSEEVIYFRVIKISK
ncbi:MAG: transcription elongation factor GreA [Clostridia bacterium]|nr:transcription elongation factor GreA [Clostridia bacterium]